MSSESNLAAYDVADDVADAPDQESGPAVSGIVKWFDGARGYGFLVPLPVRRWGGLYPTFGSLPLCNWIVVLWLGAC